jgi:hypothetical protein
LEVLLFDSNIGFNHGNAGLLPLKPELAPEQFGESLRKQIRATISLHALSHLISGPDWDSL